jgi:hypothetical protein
MPAYSRGNLKNFHFGGYPQTPGRGHRVLRSLAPFSPFHKRTTSTSTRPPLAPLRSLHSSTSTLRSHHAQTRHQRRPHRSTEAGFSIFGIQPKQSKFLVACRSRFLKSRFQTDPSSLVSVPPLRPMLDEHCAWGPLRNGAPQNTGAGMAVHFVKQCPRPQASAFRKPWCAQRWLGAGKSLLYKPA